MGWFSRDPAAELQKLQDQLRLREEITRRERQALERQAAKLAKDIADREAADRQAAFQRGLTAHKWANRRK